MIPFLVYTVCTACINAGILHWCKAELLPSAHSRAGDAGKVSARSSATAVASVITTNLLIAHLSLASAALHSADMCIQFQSCSRQDVPGGLRYTSHKVCLVKEARSKWQGSHCLSVLRNKA